jgi:hypothetical protein
MLGWIHKWGYRLPTVLFFLVSWYTFPLSCLVSRRHYFQTHSGKLIVMNGSYSLIMCTIYLVPTAFQTGCSAPFTFLISTEPHSNTLQQILLTSFCRGAESLNNLFKITELATLRFAPLSSDSHFCHHLRLSSQILPAITLHECLGCLKMIFFFIKSEDVSDLKSSDKKRKWDNYAQPVAGLLKERWAKQVCCFEFSAKPPASSGRDISVLWGEE